jgi:hypothetical protein
MRILFFCGLWILFFSTPGFSQKQLVLVKQNKVIVRINEGEYIQFKRKDRDHFTKGIIEGIQQESFRIGADTTYLYDVAAIDLRGRPNSGFKVKQSGIMLIIAGGILVLSEVFNSGEIGSGIPAVSGALITTGVFMLFVNNDIFNVGRKKRIITMGN